MGSTELRVKIEEELMKVLDEIKDFYNLNSRAELLRLMIIRFYNYVKEQKEKGYDKFNLVPYE